MPFPRHGEARWALPAEWCSQESSTPRALLVPKPPSSGPPHRHYLVYRPFFRQKEFLTDSRRLLSSRAGKLLSSKLIISLWPRAPGLALFPAGEAGEIDIRSLIPSL